LSTAIASIDRLFDLERDLDALSGLPTASAALSMLAEPDRKSSTIDSAGGWHEYRDSDPC